MCAAALGLLKDLLRNYFVANCQSHYFFIDDYHLMDDNRVTAIFLAMADISAPNLHIIIASRDEFLSHGQILRLGRRLHKIKMTDLQLNPTELSIYSQGLRVCNGG